MKVQIGSLQSIIHIVKTPGKNLHYSLDSPDFKWSPNLYKYSTGHCWLCGVIWLKNIPDFFIFLIFFLKFYLFIYLFCSNNNNNNNNKIKHGMHEQVWMRGVCGLAVFPVRFLSLSQFYWIWQNCPGFLCQNH